MFLANIMKPLIVHINYTPICIIIPPTTGHQMTDEDVETLITSSIDEALRQSSKTEIVDKMVYETLKKAFPLCEVHKLYLDNTNQKSWVGLFPE
jgi:hypothetical protein